LARMPMANPIYIDLTTQEVLEVEEERDDSQLTVDLTIDDNEVDIIDNVHSILLTYPRVEEQLARAGVETRDDGMITWWNPADNHLCQVDSIKKFFLNHLLSLPKQPDFLVVAQEFHQDGSKHIHCFVQWIGKQSFPTTYFDWHTVHPNILHCNKPRAALTYCKKQDLIPLRHVRVINLDEDEEGEFSQPNQEDPVPIYCK